MTEREAIVAWLEREAAENLESGYEEGALAYSVFLYAANEIRAGQHLENKDG